LVPIFAIFLWPYESREFIPNFLERATTMIKYSQKFGTMALALLLLSACAGDYNSRPKQTIGGLAGAAGGAVIGSNIGHGRGNIATIALGTLLGAYAGSEIGASLDRADQQYANRTAQETFESYPSGRSNSWQNPDSGNSGTIVPTSTYQTSNGQYCREYQQTVYVQGQTQQAYGTACRQQDGTWRIMN
jgi:surface antigen